MNQPPVRATDGAAAHGGTSRRPSGAYVAWMAGACAFALVPYLALFYGIRAQAGWLVQDDARHFVVWLRRLADPDLFTNDIMAAQFTGLTPWLYRAMFWPTTMAGIDPVQAHLFVMMPLTGVLFAWATFVFVHRFWPTPPGAALVSMILPNLLYWRIGLAHDFGYTAVMLTLLAFVNRRPVAAAACMFVAASLLPAAGLVAGLTMALLMLRPAWPFVSTERRAWLALMSAGVACVAAGTVAVLSAGSLGPTFSAAEAQALPIFGPEGRRPYWGTSFLSTNVCSPHGGFLPLCEDPASAAGVFFWALFVAVVLAVGVASAGSPRAARWLSSAGIPPLERTMRHVWLSLIVGGGTLFLVAHMVKFTLHMPQRFAQYAITLSFGLTVSMLLASVVLWASRVRALGRSRHAGGVLVGLAVVGCLWVSVRTLRTWANLVPSEAPVIETFLRSTPKTTLVAGVIDEVDRVPTFGSRSVLFSLELFVPYKKLYYDQMAARAEALANALYAPDASAFETLRERFHVDYVLVERVQSAEPQNLAVLAVNFPTVAPTARAIAAGREPFFRAKLPRCGVASQGNLVLADARCVATGDY